MGSARDGGSRVPSTWPVKPIAQCAWPGVACALADEIESSHEATPPMDEFQRLASSSQSRITPRFTAAITAVSSVDQPESASRSADCGVAFTHCPHETTLDRHSDSPASIAGG